MYRRAGRKTYANVASLKIEPDGVIEGGRVCAAARARTREEERREEGGEHLCRAKIAVAQLNLSARSREESIA